MSNTDYPRLFDACTPRADVLDGTLQEDQFAASLATVAHSPDDAAPVYRDAAEFYEMTYPTDGLRTLLSNLTGRFLAGGGYDGGSYSSSILCLDTRFGGGKTHDLIASYHLATNPTAVDDLGGHLLDGDGELATSYIDAAEDSLGVDTAVFVGGHVDARNARSDRSDPNAPNTRTMWGELAYQLYGLDGYEKLKEYDQERQAPGGNTLKDLFELGDGPALILVDEIAAYLEAASGVEVGNATLASQTLSFILSLLETASEVENVTIVYSIADTAFEEEAEEVRSLTNELNQIGRRQHKTITPTDETEVGQVLQHRLFEEIDDEAATQAAESYFQFYTDSDRQFPQDATDASYVSRLTREYPFHPSIVRALTEKIDTIPNFQRTRGALKLLARAVFYLWNHQPEHYDRHFVRLYDLTPGDDDPGGSIQSTLHESLFEFVELGPAVSADIYSEDGTAHAQLEDRKWTEKGIPTLGSHLTTTILWHSLAYGEQATGLSRAELNEALGHPSISFDHYDSALSDLAGDDMNVACYYLYDEERVRFKSDPNLIRIIDQRVDNTPDAQARSRFEGRLESEIGTGGFKTVVFPESAADVEDNAAEPQLSIMHIDTAPVSDGGDAIPEKIQTLYQKTASSHGGQVENRVYKNYVLFLAPDQERIRSAIDEARRLEAIEDLLDDSQQTADLSTEQIEELRERRDQAHGLLGELVRGVYRHLYYVDRDGLTHITIGATEANGGTTLVDAVQQTMEDRIIKRDAGPNGQAFFKQKLWQRTQTSMTTEQLATQFAKKPGLPYILSHKPVRETIAKMVTEAGYVYWDGEDDIAYWAGDEDDEPEGWSHAVPLANSPDIRTGVRDSDITIGDDFVVYESVKAFLDVHAGDLEVPESDEEDGSDVDDDGDEDEDTSTGGSGSSGRQGRLGGGGGISEPQTWEFTSDMASAKRALTETRNHAIAQASESDPGISEVTVEVGGEDKLSKGSFIAGRQALKDRAANVSVRMTYKTREEFNTGDATYESKFTGALEAFSRVTNQPDPFGDAEKVTLKFRIQFDDPESITDAGEDVLAELQDALEDTNIDVKVHASGPLEPTAEVEA